MSHSHAIDPNHTTLDGPRTLDDYLIASSDAEPEYLHRLWRATNLRLVNGRMTSGALQGRVLRMLVALLRPRHICEVGTFSGYSALCMAEGLEEGGRVFTFEVDDEVAAFAEDWISASPWAERVTLTVGDAATAAPRLALERGLLYDFVFLDGDKRTYTETYEALFPVLAKGAVILADNTLWDGHVIDPAYRGDPHTEAVRRFNAHIAADSRVERVMLPLRDGLTIIRVVG